MDRLHTYADDSAAHRLYPLSTAQAALWVAQALDPSSPIFNQGQYIEVFGPIEPRLFETAVRRAVAETDTLQLRFVETERGPAQYVQAYTDWNVPFFDVSANADP